MSEYRSFGAQTRHYFDRVHSVVPKTPVTSRAEWRGSQMKDRPDEWLTTLEDAEIEEISTATDDLRSSGVELPAVSRNNFLLPTLATKINAWRDEVGHGRGFVVVRGLPVDHWGEEKSAFAYWGIGHHLGLPGAQNPKNELLGHVVDYGEERDNPIVRRYRTTGNIDFHCDAADAVGLLCMRAAKSGGQSRIVSSVAIFNEAARREPALIGRLFEPFRLDRRDEQAPGQPGTVPIPPCRWSPEQGLQTFFHSEYFRSAARFADVEIDADSMRLLDLYDELCLLPEFQLDMWLEPGDMQFISNHTTMHARTAYEDWPEPERKRHLLRLWLSF